MGVSTDAGGASFRPCVPRRRRCCLEQLAEQTGLSRSALGSYEPDEFKDISHYALVRLAKFYGVTADFLLGLAETRNHPNAALAELRLSDVMIELLQSGKIDNALLCELATHPDFPRLMAELEVYVNGMSVKLVQTANAFVDAASANIVKQYDPGASDPYLRQLVAAHVDEDSFCRYLIGRDMAEIARALEEKKWLARIAEKSDLLKNPNPQRGRKKRLKR